MAEPDIKDLERRMNGAVETLRQDFAGLRTGRANTAMLDPVMVDVYGAAMPINQVATISTPEARLLSVQVWDRSNVSAVEKAIRNSGLGLNPMTEGSTLRIPVPELNEERRREMSKVASKYAEQSKVAIRNVRRDGMDGVKKSEKNGDLAQDDAKKWSERIQKLTDDHIAQVDEILSHKEKEIMQV
ncbi:ribosome-recycling factor [Iodidimonas gelatinilytica]|uniref:Ribosome-recycling factor n=2 Tax=Iodidimonas TaxID=2066486 RepID=A0A5A7N0I7_9PROT|nr:MULTISPECIES: ribosome recycling factor [Iodidimonas]GEQ96841.1 ribosome-recycling factor [Iodidimonas gelatinilytica]GER01164.1 ribosome-recycling factor [Iodidimonas gelatinilytica]GER06992.1 ribosome-recycling factor [Kordiimonadales bacterium JCM 17843]GGO13414.1 ribosome-recycling factor [Iodidimonas muriae]